ncbi:MAG TPA: hypothetical protein VF517_14440 [Thermoleophilaceae bacterium]
MAPWTRLSPLALVLALVCLGVTAASASAANSNRLYVNASADRPAGVDASRLYDVADHSASRWKLSVEGNASRMPGVKDGTQVIGFSKATAAQALGVTTVWSRTLYKVVTTRRCWRQNGRRRCQTTRRYVKNGVEVVEKDVQLNPSVPWEQGPSYPSPTRFDLESTILHELGHFANPLKDNHVFGCENSPMIDSIAPGEFWRDADDWLRYGCSASAGGRSKLAVPAAPQMRMLVVEHRLPPRFEH